MKSTARKVNTKTSHVASLHFPVLFPACQTASPVKAKLHFHPAPCIPNHPRPSGGGGVVLCVCKSSIGKCTFDKGLSRWFCALCSLCGALRSRSKELLPRRLLSSSGSPLPPCWSCSSAELIMAISVVRGQQGRRNAVTVRVQGAPHTPQQVGTPHSLCQTIVGPK